jgi:hypothetical protein
MARLVLKGVLAVSLLAGVVVLLAGHQLNLLQSMVRGESLRAPLLVPALVLRFESVLGSEAMLAPPTLNVTWVTGGILAGVGFLGLLVVGLQDSSQARMAARLVPPPTFDARDRVSLHHFVPEGLESRTRLIRFFGFPALLATPFGLLGVYAAVIHGQWVTALVVLGAMAAKAAMGVFLWRGDKDRYLKKGVERIDIMTGWLRWVRHGNPTVRIVAWSQIAGCRSYHNYQSSRSWQNQTVVTLRTGEKFCLWACCVSDYDACVDLVNRGRKEGRLPLKSTGVAGLATAFLLNR